MKKYVVIAVAAVVVLGGLAALRLAGASFDVAAVRQLLAGLGPWGPLALVAALAAVLVVPVIPASAFQIAAGLAFGPWLGLLAVSLADVLGASLGFWLARRWGGQITRRLSPASQAQIERLTRRTSWRMVMLLRLLPGPAYPLVSFAAGFSPLGFWAYTAASFAGVFPALALLVFAGDLVTRSPLLATALVVALVGSLALAGRLLGRAAADDPAPDPGGAA